MGYPDWWDHTRGSRKRHFNNTTNGVAGQASAIVAMTTTAIKAFNIFPIVSNSAWITNSRCTDHRTFDYSQVSPLEPSLQNYVCTANCSSDPVIGEKSLTLTNTLSLDSV